MCKVGVAGAILKIRTPFCPQTITSSVPNYRSFDFLNPKFDHSSYSKIVQNIIFLL
jgi:hypothetical protein